MPQAHQNMPSVTWGKNYPKDPYLYLHVMNEWYCYNPNDKPLGSGAMGDVYLGYRCSNGLEIAVKRVKDSYASNKMIRERARQEASLAFRHPNLVEMIGYCEYAPDYGPIFLLSNFVKGEDLDEYVKKLAPQRKVDMVCRAMCSVLDALEYIHSRGVIHRDIKPSNIMVENNSNVRLMDLGISRMNGGNQYSQFGFIGTPQYSAPEQIKRGEDGAGTINATTDLYALGITFYELLTEENPMDAPSQAETLKKQLSDNLPSHKDIPKKLMKVIWKATEKDQSKRFQSAEEMRNAIQEAIKPELKTGDKFSAWMQNHIVLTAVLIAVIVVLAFVIILSSTM